MISKHFAHAAVVCASVVCVACTGVETRSSVAPFATTPRDQRVKVKKHRVLVPSGFAVEGSTRMAHTGLTEGAAELCARALARDQRLAQVDSQDVLLAPDAFQTALYDFVLAGELIVQDERISAVRLNVLSARGGQLVASVETPCAPLPIERASLEQLGLDALTARACQRLAEQPWSTSVLDKAERLIIVGGGPETGLVPGETLIVRLVENDAFERGIDRWLSFATSEVARIQVESFVGTTDANYGAQCRLIGGTFGGFDSAELVITLPDDVR